MTEKQIKIAMLELLNSSSLQDGARFIADILGISTDEVLSTVREFEYRGIRFERRLEIVGSYGRFVWECA